MYLLLCNELPQNLAPENSSCGPKIREQCRWVVLTQVSHEVPTKLLSVVSSEGWNGE